MFGLDPDTLINIKNIFSKFENISKVILYGSRAKGNYKKGSDIDITLVGKELNLNNTVYPLMDAIEELYLPYTFDISILKQIDNKNLIDHINRVGKVFYEKKKELPKDWKIKKLGGVIKLEYGKPLDKSLRIPNGYYPMYGANGVKGRTNEFYYNKKTIIIGRKGSAGAINLTEEKFWPLDVTYFIIFDETKYNLFFLFCLLSNKQLPKLAKGIKPGINRNDVYNLNVHIPPLHEQQRIAAILDKVFTAIAKAKSNAEQNLKNAKELFDSYLQRVFDNGKLKIKSGEWEEQKLGKCFKFKSGDGLTKKMMSEDSIYPVFGGNGIAGSHNSFNVSSSNIIVGRVGALCGNARHLTQNIWLTDNAFKIVDFKYKFNHSFLTYLLNFKNLRSFARQAAQPVISNSSLKDVLLQFPKKISEQQNIVQKLDALSAETKRLEDICQQKIEDLKELKKSVLQKAFNGEL